MSLSQSPPPRASSHSHHRTTTAVRDFETATHSVGHHVGGSLGVDDGRWRAPARRAPAGGRAHVRVRDGRAGDAPAAGRRRGRPPGGDRRSGRDRASGERRRRRELRGAREGRRGGPVGLCGRVRQVAGRGRRARVAQHGRRRRGVLFG